MRLDLGGRDPARAPWKKTWTNLQTWDESMGKPAFSTAKFSACPRIATRIPSRIAFKTSDNTHSALDSAHSVGPPFHEQMSEELKFIVQMLNRPPFSMKLTLVLLDSKRGLELLQVVNDVFAYLNPKQKRDLRDEDPAGMAARMLEFAVILNYKTGTELYVHTHTHTHTQHTVVSPVRSLSPRLSSTSFTRLLSRSPRPLSLPPSPQGRFLGGLHQG